MLAVGLIMNLPRYLVAEPSPAVPPGESVESSAALELMEILRPSRGYLFDEAGQALIERLNRQIRETRERESKADQLQTTRGIAAEREQAEKKLFDLVEQCAQLVEVKLAGGHAIAEASAPIRLPGDAGALLIRVRMGAGEACCRRVEYDLSQSRASIPLDIAPTGTTWAVVGLTNVPAGVSSLVFEFKPLGGKVHPLALSVKAPQPAHVWIQILSARTGEPVPAMIELTWKTDGAGRRPVNAVDFSGQFDNLGRASAQRHANLAGRLNGRLWWCVPGPFDMPLPPGEWHIAIRHGLEYVPVTDAFQVAPGQMLEKTYRLRQWVDMPSGGWYSGDDHVHCRLTSDDDADRLMAWARAEDVHVINVLRMGDVYRTWFQQRGFGPAFRKTSGNYVLVPGQECPRTHSDGFGHTISLNLTAAVRDVDRYWLYDWAADAVHAQGGLFGFAHAYLTHPYIRRGMSLIATAPRVDFAEIMQVGQMGTDFYYDFLNLGYKLTATAGSDVPWQGTLGEVRTYAFIGRQPFSADAWFDALRNGRTFVTNGPMLELRVDEAMPGDQITLGQAGSLHVRARAWGDPDVMVPVRLEIVCHGEVIRQAESSDLGRQELTLDFELPAEDGFWLAARATGSDGSRAHTTPVYAVREPLRFWKLEAVNGLIAQRMENLQDIERLMAEARRRVETGEDEGNLTARTMAQQAGELQIRISAARAFYNDLLNTAARERKLRSSP
ncbi:MAG: hypothetical protein AMXMBFR13_20950 [Phycisphaerae bacterium]